MKTQTKNTTSKIDIKFNVIKCVEITPVNSAVSIFHKFQPLRHHTNFTCKFEYKPEPK